MSTELSVPNGRFANYSGRAFELAMLKRGAGAAAGVGAAAGSVAVVSSSNRGWKIVSGAVSGAGLGAASGCATGFIAGAIVASVPGCGVMALMGAIGGGFMGAYGGLTSIDTEGKLQVEVKNIDEIAKMVGDSVRKNSLADAGDTLDLIRIPAPDRLYDQDWAPVIDKTGISRFFPCATYGDVIRQCIIINTLGQSGQAVMYDADNAPYTYRGTALFMPSYKLCQENCGNQPGVFLYAGTVRYAGGNTNGTIFLSSVRSYGSAKEVPQETLVPSPDVPLWATMISDKLDAQVVQMKLSNQALAAILNKAHMDMPATPGVPSYDPNNPITPEEIEQQLRDNPSMVRPTLGDLARPWSTPGQDAQPTNSTSTVSPPQPVQIVGGTGSSTTIKAEIDLGPAGDATMPSVDQKAEIPFWSQVTGALDPWRNLSVNWTQPSCPVYPIDATFFAGRRAHWDIDIHCQLLPDGSPQDALLGIVLLFSYGLIAVRKALSA